MSLSEWRKLYIEHVRIVSHCAVCTESHFVNYFYLTVAHIWCSVYGNIRIHVYT